MDESVGSIDDGNYATPPSGLSSSGATLYGPYDMWANYPASFRHGNASGFSYADGHAADISWRGTQLQTWDTTGATGPQFTAMMSGEDLIDLRTVQAGMALPDGE